MRNLKVCLLYKNISNLFSNFNLQKTPTANFFCNLGLQLVVKNIMAGLHIIINSGLANQFLYSYTSVFKFVLPKFRLA